MTDEEYLEQLKADFERWSRIDDDPDFFDELNEFLELEDDE